jgi:4-amino-4-deoxy-L-arabinose transferase-like glycosyltransferase
MTNIFQKHTYVFILLAALLLFFPFLGAVHLFDWDEINFAECAREMLVMNDYTRVYIDFQPFWEKPPLFFWLQAASMKVFGINEFAARFPNAVCGVITLLVLYRCGKSLLGKKFGLYWPLAFAGSLFPNMYFKSGIIDPWFNLFTFLSLYYFIRYHWRRNNYGKEDLKRSQTAYATLSGIFMGLALLTKGHAALVIFLLVLFVYLLLNRFRFYFSWWHALLFLAVALLVSSAWYGYETIRNGPWFITQFIRYQYELFTTHVAGHAGFFGYHFVVILLGCFPASVFALPSFFSLPFSTRYEKDFKTWMVILCLVVLVLFTITQSRIVHYSALAWYPVTFLAAYTFYKLEKNELRLKAYIKILFSVLGILYAFVLTAFPFLAMNLDKIIPYVKDKFAQANMQAQVNWTGWESLIGLWMLAVVIAGLWFIQKRKFRNASGIIFGGTALFVFLASAIIVPKVERYSQGAAIDFFKERRGEDCYVDVIGYKSYAQLFYTLKKKPENENAYDREWLLTGPIDKPAYFVTRLDRVHEVPDLPDLKELYRKNGFIFYKRDKPGK